MFKSCENTFYVILFVSLSVRWQERTDAQQLFKGKKGKQLEKEMGATKDRGQAGQAGTDKAAGGGGGRQLEAVRQAIMVATTLDQMEHLSSALQAGAPLPTSGKAMQPPGTEDVEMEAPNGH